MLKPNETELEVARALVRVWSTVTDAERELANILALERERHLRHFESLLFPIGDEVERKLVNVEVLKDAIARVREGRL